MLGQLAAQGTVLEIVDTELEEFNYMVEHLFVRKTVGGRLLGSYKVGAEETVLVVVLGQFMMVEVEQLVVFG